MNKIEKVKLLLLKELDDVGCKTCRWSTCSIGCDSLWGLSDSFAEKLAKSIVELDRELIDDDALDTIEYGIKITLGRCVTRERPAKDDNEREALESIGADPERWVEGVELVDVQPTPEDLAVVRSWLEKWETVT